MNKNQAAVAITGLGLVTQRERGRHTEAVLTGQSGAAQSPCSTPAVFRRASPPRSRSSTMHYRRSQAHQFANRRTVSRCPPPSRQCATRASNRRPDRRSLGLRGRYRLMGVAYADPKACSANRGRWRAASGAVPTDAPTIRWCSAAGEGGLALLTRRFGIRGYATSVHTACASGGQAIGTALKLIRRGSVDALAGGFDWMISPVGLAGFCLLSAVSTDNDTPEGSRPFDATRNGSSWRRRRLCSAEEWESARRRGAHIYASLPATAIRCRRTASPIRRPTATAPSVDAIGARRRRTAAPLMPTERRRS